jgi:Beta-lactamase enzyme family
MKKFLLFILLICNADVLAQERNLIESLMQQQPEQFNKILADPHKYEVQIIYTQIDRDAKNRPKFTTHQYRVNNDTYFYPASTVKFPAVLLALEKINNLKINGLSKSSVMFTDSSSERQTQAWADTSAANGLPSVEHYIKKILLVSDNDAYNRLYEFVGQEEFNKKLHAKGYTNSRIVHRLSYAMTPQQNNTTNQVRFMTDNKPVYTKPALTSSLDLTPRIPIRKGIGYMKDTVLVREPFDFTTKNFFALTDQQTMLKAVMFPASVPAQQRFNLSASDYDFVRKYMSQLPSETRYPRYDSKEYYDSFCKFMLFGDSKTAMPKHIRIFNKVGDAYGYLLDNAYVVDFEQNIEFMLTAVIYCNEDQVFNDDKYDYHSVGFPFFANLGKLIYNYEKKRIRKHKPNLSAFKIIYDK